MITLLRLLPWFASLLGGLGVCILAVACWRVIRTGPGAAWPPLRLAALGFGLLVTGMVCYSQVLASHRGRLDWCRSHLVKGTATALDMYAQDHDGDLPESLSELTPTYLKFLAACPAVGKETYSATYRRFRNAKGEWCYIVACGGTNHSWADVTVEDRPMFHSTTGSLIEDELVELKKP